MWLPQIGDIVIFSFLHVTGYTDEGPPRTERRQRPAIVLGGPPYALELQPFYSGPSSSVGDAPLSPDAPFSRTADIELHNRGSVGNVRRGPGDLPPGIDYWWHPRPGQERF
jgi:hypothetical protein